MSLLLPGTNAKRRSGFCETAACRLEIAFVSEAARLVARIAPGALPRSLMSQDRGIQTRRLVMRIHSKLLAAGVALVAAPALGQVSVGTETGVGVGVNVPVRDTVNSVHDTVDRTVDTVDRRVNRTLDRTNTSLAVATSADVTVGASVSDSRGRRIGTVQSASADTAVIVSGNHRLRVPISSLYRSADGLAARMTRAQFNARARAQARAN
jgi:hypothetical protein